MKRRFLESQFTDRSNKKLILFVQMFNPSLEIVARKKALTLTLEKAYEFLDVIH
jgi:hypothetical protein